MSSRSAWRNLERRPAPAIAPSPPAHLASAAPVAAAPPAPAYASRPVSLSPGIPVAVSLAPQAPVLDVKAIERDVNIEVDGALDGRKRRRRLLLSFTFLLVAVFGGLFAALARSYQPH